MEVVRQHYNHPSIVTWVPFNESWGIGQIFTDRKHQQFTESIYHLTKSYDQMRPVVVNDGWEHTISDIITLHDYEELGSVLEARYKDKDAPPALTSPMTNIVIHLLMGTATKASLLSSVNTVESRLRANLDGVTAIR